ncbi:hypothetical protein ACJX0J_039912, partial [Zea mays]
MDVDHQWVYDDGKRISLFVLIIDFNIPCFKMKYVCVGINFGLKLFLFNFHVGYAMHVFSIQTAYGQGMINRIDIIAYFLKFQIWYIMWLEVLSDYMGKKLQNNIYAVMYHNMMMDNIDDLELLNKEQSE